MSRARRDKFCYLTFNGILFSFMERPQGGCKERKKGGKSIVVSMFFLFYLKNKTTLSYIEGNLIHFKNLFYSLQHIVAQIHCHATTCPQPAACLTYIREPDLASTGIHTADGHSSHLGKISMCLFCAESYLY